MFKSGSEKFIYVMHILHVLNILERKMVSITLAVSKELKEEMDKHPEFNWSEVARQAIKEKLAILAKMDKLLSKSRLNEKDTLELGRKVNKAAAKRVLKEI